MSENARHLENKSKVYVNKDGTLILNNKAFFPFGLYHVSWQTTSDKRIKHLREIAAGGFNTIKASFSRYDNFDDYESFLIESERLDVKVVTGFDLGSSIDPIKVVNMFKDKSAVIGWDIADDVDSFKDNFTPSYILDLHCKFKKEDPNHITYISGSKEKRISRYANTSDAIGVQAYPIGNEGQELPLSWAKKMVSIAHESAPKNRLIIGNIQAFKWYHENAKMPTFKEIRNLTYQALLGGAKGIIYYTYYDSGWYLSEHPDLWNGLKSLVPEIKQLSPLLLDGNLKEINTKDENVLAGVWEHEGRLLFVAINTSHKSTVEVSIKLNGSMVEPMFSDQPSSLTFRNGQLSGILNPLDVHVYNLRG